MFTQHFYTQPSTNPNAHHLVNGQINVAHDTMLEHIPLKRKEVLVHAMKQMNHLENITLSEEANHKRTSMV